MPFRPARRDDSLRGNSQGRRKPAGFYEPIIRGKDLPVWLQGFMRLTVVPGATALILKWAPEHGAAATRSQPRGLGEATTAGRRSKLPEERQRDRT